MKDDLLHGQRLALRMVEDYNKALPENITVCKDALKTIVGFSTLLFSILTVSDVWKPIANIWPLVAATGFYVLIIATSCYLYRPIAISSTKMTWENLYKYFFNEEEKKVLEEAIASYLEFIDDNGKIITRFERWTFAVQILFVLFVIATSISVIVRVI